HSELSASSTSVSQ
ncbi:hypothetical protein EC890511_2943, partial [Escherichia coli 89.0511]